MNQCLATCVLNAAVTQCTLPTLQGRVSVQQFRDGVVLRMCRGLITTLFVGFFDNQNGVQSDCCSESDDVLH